MNRFTLSQQCLYREEGNSLIHWVSACYDHLYSPFKKLFFHLWSILTKREKSKSERGGFNAHYQLCQGKLKKKSKNTFLVIFNISMNGKWQNGRMSHEKQSSPSKLASGLSSAPLKGHRCTSLSVCSDSWVFVSISAWKLLSAFVQWRQKKSSQSLSQASPNPAKRVRTLSTEGH